MAKPAPAPTLKADEESPVVETTAAPAPAVASKPEQGGDAPAPAPAAPPAGDPAPELAKAAATAAEPAEAQVTLDDWCNRKAENSRQQHAIKAFYDEEYKGERYRDTPAAYEGRYVAMMQRPAA